MGLLGVIMEVTFQCEPKFNLEETTTIPPFDECIDNLGELAHSAEHVKFWLELCSQSCAYYQTNCPKDEPRNRPQTLLNTLKASHSHITIIMHYSTTCFLLQNVLLEFVISIVSWILASAYHSTMKFVFDALQLFSPQNRVDISDKVFLVPDYFLVFSQAEIAVDINDCTAAMREVGRIISELAIPVNYIEVSRLRQ